VALTLFNQNKWIDIDPRQLGAHCIRFWSYAVKQGLDTGKPSAELLQSAAKSIVEYSDEDTITHFLLDSLEKVNYSHVNFARALVRAARKAGKPELIEKIEARVRPMMERGEYPGLIQDIELAKFSTILPDKEAFAQSNMDAFSDCVLYLESFISCRSDFLRIPNSVAAPAIKILRDYAEGKNGELVHICRWFIKAHGNTNGSLYLLHATLATIWDLTTKEPWKSSIPEIIWTLVKDNPLRLGALVYLLIADQKENIGFALDRVWDALPEKGKPGRKEFASQILAAATSARDKRTAQALEEFILAKSGIFAKLLPKFGKK
jgi:hypothetical protein